MPTPTSFYPYDLNRRRPADIPRLTLVSPPATEVWTVSDQEVLQAIKLDPNPTDSQYVTLLLKSARRYFERITGLALIQQTWKVSYDRIPGSRGDSWPLPNEVELPKAPLISLDIVNYLDTSGNSQTATLSDYAVGNVGSSAAYGRARLKDTAAWPDISTDPGALSFTFKAGYGLTAASVPEDVRFALLILSTHWYENRLPVITQGARTTAYINLPLQLQAMIDACTIAGLA